MKIGYRTDGEAMVLRYEVGDLVVMTVDEPGEFGTAKAGDWGKVTGVDAGGLLTIMLAGYSLPPSAALRAVSDISQRIVMPCDPRGKPQAVGGRSQRQTVDRTAR